MDIKDVYKQLQNHFEQIKIKYGYLQNDNGFNFKGGVFSGNIAGDTVVGEEPDEKSTVMESFVINRTHRKTGNVIFYVQARILYYGANCGIFADKYMYSLATHREDRKIDNFYTQEKLLNEFDRIFKAEYKRVMRMNQQKLVKQINSLPG
jgi:hypothetical protein